MRRVPNWAVQLSWTGCGIFATGAVWYFLSLKEYRNASFSAAAAVAFAALAVFLHWKQDKADSNDAPGSPAEEFTRRYTDQPGHIRFLKSLPKLRRIVLENAQEGWDTGVTAEMRQSSYDVIDFLEYTWLRLAEFYPVGHFGRSNPRTYIRDYLRSRFEFHWARHEPDGPGTGGTIVGVMVGGDVIHDLEQMIEDLVGALFAHSEDFDYPQWLADWTRNREARPNDT